ncbi:MAG: hypothetical protein ACREC0_10610 [Methylocella sp.]
MPETSVDCCSRGILERRQRRSAGPAAADRAAQVWAAIQNTTSVAVPDDYIRQFDNTPYGSTARARREELRRSQFANVTPSVQVPQATGGLPKNDEEAMRLYKLAAGQGNAYAKIALRHLDFQ